VPDDEANDVARAPRTRSSWLRRALVPVLVCCLLLGAAAGALVIGRWRHLAAPIVAIEPLLPGAPAVVPPTAAPPATVPSPGFDVSYPQCGSPLPKSGGFAIVGLNGGHALSSNKCAATQLKWAQGKAGHAVYVNTGYAGVGDPIAHGRTLVDDAVAREHALGVSGTAVWWLDVETVNTWAGTQQQNATVLDSMAARLQELGVRVGIYSTPKMWDEIAGPWSPGLPVWYATGPGTASTAGVACTRSFAGSSSAIAQWVETTADGELDHNLICPAYSKRAADLLDLG